MLTFSRVLELKVLILELTFGPIAIDGLATAARALGEITALAHETGNDSVHDASLVPKSCVPSEFKSKSTSSGALQFSAQVHGVKHRGSHADSALHLKRHEEIQSGEFHRERGPTFGVSAKGTKVLCRDRNNITAEFDHDAPRGLPIQCDVHEHFRPRVSSVGAR